MKIDTRKLYSIEIIERKDHRVKVHYIGYSSKYDEWKEKSEIEFPGPQCDQVEDEEAVVYEPFSLYKDLSLRIKRALSCNRKASPIIKLSMPFDLRSFNGGLKLVGVPGKNLVEFNRHVKGINGNGDYGYVLKETVEFCIRRCRRLTEYVYDPSKIFHRCRVYAYIQLCMWIEIKGFLERINQFLCNRTRCTHCNDIMHVSMYCITSIIHF